MGKVRTAAVALEGGGPSVSENKRKHGGRWVSAG
jgi:hypothetical protein